MFGGFVDHIESKNDEVSSNHADDLELDQGGE